MNFNDVKTEVKARLDNRTDIDARLETWINHAYFDILMRPAFSFFELDTSYTFSTTVGTRSYTNFPADFWFVLGLRDETTEREIRRTSWKVFDRVAHADGLPTRYARFQNTIYLDPTPNDIVTILVRYRKRTNALAVGGMMIWGTEWDELLVVLATAKGFQALKQYDAAKQELTIFATLASGRQDQPELEDDDSEFGIEVRLEE